MGGDYCPACGQPRVGAFRFCRSCGLDYDGLQDGPPVAGDVPPETTSKGKPILRYAALGVAALVGLGAIGNLMGGGPTDAPTSSPIARSTPTAAASPTVSTIALSPQGGTQEATVVRVIDGDTIVVDIDGTEYHVRYIGMDTPESVDPDSPVEPLALSSTAANEALVGGKTVVLEKDVSEVDQFDRLLRNVWVERDGVLVMVGMELVRSGFADVATYPPDVRYADTLADALDEARSSGRGLWAAAETSAPTSAPVPVATPLTVVSIEPLAIVANDKVAFRGEAGSYRWTDVSFDAKQAIVRWDVSANPGACRVAWTLDPNAGKTIKSTVRVAANDREKGVERYGSAFSSGTLLVSSTCSSWLLSIEGNDPPVAGGGGGSGGSSCHPSYSPCLPIVGDLDCADVRAMGKAPVTVKGPDEYRLDREGDGLGCE